MNLLSLWSGKGQKLLICVAIATLVVLGTCAFLRIWRPRDIEAYLGMAAECHPVWRQFAFRRYGVGDSAARLLQQYPPSRREEFGPYGVYRYYQGNSNEIPFTGLSMVTRNGKLISAGSGSCTWRYVFFHTEDAELDQQYRVFAKERHAKLERQRLERLESKLRGFYSQQGRWPTNQKEFSFFVTGSRGITTNDFGTTLVQGRPARRRQVGVDQSTNDLGITLVERPDGAMELTLVEFPDEKRVVARPETERRNTP